MLLTENKTVCPLFHTCGTGPMSTGNLQQNDDSSCSTYLFIKTETQPQVSILGMEEHIIFQQTCFTVSTYALRKACRTSATQPTAIEYSITKYFLRRDLRVFSYTFSYQSWLKNSWIINIIQFLALGNLFPQNVPGMMISNATFWIPAEYKVLTAVLAEGWEEMQWTRHLNLLVCWQSGEIAWKKNIQSGQYKFKK